MVDWKEQLAGLMDTLPQVPNQDTPCPSERGKGGKVKQQLKVQAMKRSGKWATIIFGHTGTDEEIAELAHYLKTQLAVGGSVRDGEILLQGDHRETVKDLINKYYKF